MRTVLTLILTLLAATSCDESVEDPGCDVFSGSATVTGAVHDFEGRPLPNADLEFTISDTSRCSADFRQVFGRGKTDTLGRYDVLVQSDQTVGMRCVFGRVARSDSISLGRVNFTSDCRRAKPANEVLLDLVATPSAVIPEDLEITLRRSPPFHQGPMYSVSVDAHGFVEFEGISGVTVVGKADSTVALDVVARLYRAFEEIGYWHIKEIYRPDECVRYGFDNHHAGTSVVANGRTKQVLHDHGCYGIPVLDSLTRLECRIDTVLSTEVWVGSWPWGPCR